MLALAIGLSLLMGLSLGLLGGGGSILAVPILHYVVGLPAKEAITTSLLVVGATSLFVTLQHARAGHVQWRTGLIFGGVAMAGAYLGGLAAAGISGDVLLVLFAAMMLIAGVAMLRRGSSKTDDEPKHTPALWKAAIEGLLVGFVTGLVGAGGGFLVVPALVLFGGVGIRDAVGTSALVITMKSFAGFAGHASHGVVDLEIGGLVVGVAVAGSFVGAWLARRVSAGSLKRIFGGFVLAMAAFMLLKEASPAALHAIFVERWPFWAGGLAIGLFVLGFLRVTGKLLGVSTGYADACAAPFDPAARRSWRLPFVAGLIGGGLIAALAAGGVTPTVAMGAFDAVVTDSPTAKILLFTGGGVLLGFGARLAGGCTSGHGIVGVAQMARSSLVATAAFMVAGFAVTALLLALN